MPRVKILRLLFIFLSVGVSCSAAHAQACGRLQYYDVDSDKVYAPGQQIRYMETRGAYSGFLSVDSMYFVCPTKVSIKTHKASSDGFLVDDTGTVTIRFRRATEAGWSDASVEFLCEDRVFTVGKMETATYPVLGKMQVGATNAICDLPPPSSSASAPPKPAVRQGQQLVGRYFTSATLVTQMNNPATENLAQAYLEGAYDLAQQSGRSCAVRGTTTPKQLEQIFGEYLASHPAVRDADRTAASVAADAFAEHWPCKK
jgi:hypothetical protein